MRIKKYSLIIFLIFLKHYSFSQKTIFPEHLNKTAISKLKNGDSLIYYQCYVDSAVQEITTSSNKKLKTKKKKITITEKFVFYKTDTIYNCKYFNSSITNYPNKKFPYLKLLEVENWGFELKKETQLTQIQLLMIAALELKSHAITYYELNINKTCANEIIIRGKNINEQLIIEGNYILSKVLNF